MNLPKLIVFDLDYTLWPFWIDTHHDPPFTMRPDGIVYDRHSQPIPVFPDVPMVLRRLFEQGATLAVASRTSCTAQAKELCRLFGWDMFFTYKEIYPGSKLTHFNSFHQKSGIKYEDMLFFDDEQRNITEVGKLGVTCILASEGVSEPLLHHGLATFSSRRQQQRRPFNS